MAFMEQRSKRLVFIAALVVGIFICSWGVVYASAGKMIEVYPPAEGTVANKMPAISVKWLNLPGVSIKSIELEIDGLIEPVSVPAKGTRFTFVPTEPLEEGRHKVRAKIVFGLGVPREIETEWTFEIDTEPPKIDLADGASYFVSNGPSAKVPIKSEEDAVVEISLNDKSLGSRTVKKSGELAIDIHDLKDKNTLNLLATDKAGNARAVVLPVIKDETAPVIVTISPAEDEVVRAMTPMIEVALEEKETGLKSIKLVIDDQEAVVKGDDGSNRVTYLGELLKDGTHTVMVEAIDYADHVTTKEWNFTIDSRRIVVNRGERRLYYYKDGGLVRTYRVAVGQAGYPTPPGNWSVVNRQYMPRWVNPGSDWAKDMPKVIPPGYNNPLGVRALALNATAILIHGTSDYGSIGSAASHGCIRMRNSDIVNFYPLIGVGVPVDIIN